MTFRTIAAELQHVKAERDAYLAYAAALQLVAKLKDDQEWTSAEAVEFVRRHAVLSRREASDAGWDAGYIVMLSACRDAVRAAGERQS
jgi:hypothetical protein